MIIKFYRYRTFHIVIMRAQLSTEVTVYKHRFALLWFHFFFRSYKERFWNYDIDYGVSVYRGIGIADLTDCWRFAICDRAGILKHECSCSFKNGNIESLTKID